MTLLVAAVLLQTPVKLAPDVSRSKIAAQPVSGKLEGKAFRPTRVEWRALGPSRVTVAGKVVDQTEQHILAFRTGDGFMPDQEVQVGISFDKGKPLTPRTWNWRPAEFNTELYRKQSYPVSKKGGSVARGITAVNAGEGGFSEGFSAHLQFLKEDRGTLIGQIALAMSDGSYLNGTFKAKIVS